jgi:hypothetical protein
MEPEPADPKKRPRRRWQFSLTTLFLLVTIASVVLSQFYPRVYVSTQVQIPGMTATTAPTYREVVLSNRVLSGAATRYPQINQLAGIATPSWLRANIEVRHMEKDILDIRMAGRPSERDRMQGLVNAIAEEYVDFLTPLTGRVSNVTIATLESQRRQLKSSLDELELPDEAEGTTSNQELLEMQAQLQARQAMLQSITARIEELKAKQQKASPSPKVIGSSSGVDW